MFGEVDSESLENCGSKAELCIRSLKTREQADPRLYYSVGGTALPPVPRTALLSKELELEELWFSWWTPPSATANNDGPLEMDTFEGRYQDVRAPIKTH